MWRLADGGQVAVGWVDVNVITTAEALSTQWQPAKPPSPQVTVFSFFQLTIYIGVLETWPRGH